MNENLTEKFAGYLSDASQTDFSGPCAEQAKKCILDYLGAVFAGASMLRKKNEKLLGFFGAGNDAAVIGLNRKSGLQNAAFINGMSAHAAELDDGERFGMFHPGAPVISALLSLAETEGIGGKGLIAGVITGYEAAVRIASCIQPSHRDRGYMATGTCGTIGAAVGAAAALGFTKSVIKNAISSAAAAAAGILKTMEDASELKPFNAGLSALCGLTAAFTARAGFIGPRDVLGGEKGFIRLMADNYDLSRLEKKSGEPWCVERVYFKPYAACRHCHPAIEAVLKIRAERKIKAEDVKSVLVRTYRHAVERNEHTLSEGVTSAKMSTPFGVAAALLFGKAGMEEYTPERVSDPVLASLAGRVDVRADDELTALSPGRRSAVVTIKTAGGECYGERIDIPKGEPENPMSRDEIEEKFMSLAMYAGKSGQDAENIIGCVNKLETESGRLYGLLL